MRKNLIDDAYHGIYSARKFPLNDDDKKKVIKIARKLLFRESLK